MNSRIIDTAKALAMSIPFAIALCMVACSGDSSNASSAGDDETEIDSGKDNAKSSSSEAESSSSSEEDFSNTRHVFENAGSINFKEGCDHLDIDDEIWAYYTVLSSETFGERRLEHYVLVNDTTYVDSLYIRGTGSMRQLVCSRPGDHRGSYSGTKWKGTDDELECFDDEGIKTITIWEFSTTDDVFFWGLDDEETKQALKEKRERLFNELKDECKSETSKKLESTKKDEEEEVEEENEEEGEEENEDENEEEEEP
ncbi:MAG: hypothetical protein J6U20_10550 [Fibrobacter sp.]|nr:hypothetical protein [Fibrobacter sp.]